MKRTLKIILGIIIFFTLPSLLFFGIMYAVYNEPLPIGKEGPEADTLALKIQKAVNHDAYLATGYLEWTFKGRHHYKWNRKEQTVKVYWKKYKVILNFAHPARNKAYKAEEEIKNEADKQKLIQKAIDYFNNDSFWLVAPHKLFDPGVRRSLVETDSRKPALLVTYTRGGTTPGDSYLWILDKNNRPIGYKMWVDIIPIGGLEASWEAWKTMESGVQLATSHRLLFLELDMGNVLATP